MVKPRQVEPQGPLLSTKGPFVKFDPVDSTISGNNHKKPLDNYIIDKFFCMIHPNRGGHTQKNEKPDFRIRMNRDGSEKKILILNHIKASVGVL